MEGPLRQLSTLVTRSESAVQTRHLVTSVSVLAVLLTLCSCNPFAPAVRETDGTEGGLVTDQTTIEGLFQNFRYAYTFKDTTIYGGLLAGNFTFTFRDYDKLIDESWGRDEEMRITWHLFQNAQNLNLVWNDVVGFAGDSLSSSVTRSFTLTVTFNPSDIIRVDGRVRLDLRRERAAHPWRILLWKDESNY
jgi:hypothetical protein